RQSEILPAHGTGGRGGEQIAVGAEDLDRDFVCKATVIELHHHMATRGEFTDHDEVPERVSVCAGPMGDDAGELGAREEPHRVNVVHHRLTNDLLDGAWDR